VGLLLSPLIALVLVLVLPNERDGATSTGVRVDERPPYESKRGPCPRCGESIPMGAAMCRFCNLDLEAYDDEVLSGRVDR
jgi:hypothetical protein